MNRNIVITSPIGSTRIRVVGEWNLKGGSDDFDAMAHAEKEIVKNARQVLRRMVNNPDDIKVRPISILDAGETEEAYEQALRK